MCRGQLHRLKWLGVVDQDTTRLYRPRTESYQVIDNVTALRNILGGYTTGLTVKYLSRKINVNTTLLAATTIEWGHSSNEVIAQMDRFGLSTDDLYLLWQYNRLFGADRWIQYKHSPVSTRTYFLPFATPMIWVVESTEALLNLAKAEGIKDVSLGPADYLQVPIPSRVLRRWIRVSYNRQGYNPEAEYKVTKLNNIAASHQVRYWQLVNVKMTRSYNQKERIMKITDVLWEEGDLYAIPWPRPITTMRELKEETYNAWHREDESREYPV